MKTTCVHAARGNRGFTLIEMLVVVAIIAVLASMLAVQAIKSAEIANQMKMVAVALELKNGINGYELDYQRFPLDHPATGEQDAPEMLTDGSNRIVDALLGVPTATQSGQRELNPLGTRFAELSQAKGGRSGIVGADIPRRLHDLWGHPFHILLDTNGDQQVKNPDIRNQEPRVAQNAPAYLPVRAAVYSTGKDGAALTKDDIVSWR